MNHQNLTWGDSNKNDRECLLYLLGVQKVVLVPLTAGCLATNCKMRFVLELVHVPLLMVKKSQVTLKTGPSYLIGILFSSTKISVHVYHII